MAENKERETKRERGRGRKVFWIVVVVAGLLTMVHYGLGSMRHHHHGRHTVHSPSDVKGRMVRKAERALKEVNATLEQRARINEIIDGLVPDIVGFQKEREELKIRIVKALERGDTSPDAFEQARASSVTLAEKAINRSFEAIVAVSAVLTPDQRRELLKEWDPRG
jgi:Spy/CpxP family protein refolding chaperone